MLQVASLIVLLLRACLLSLASPASSSGKVPYLDDSEEAWHQGWSSQHHQPDASQVDADLNQHSASQQVSSSSHAPTASGYVVDLSPERYLQKYHDAIANKNAAKAESSLEKYKLLINNDVRGMRGMVNFYRRKHEGWAEDGTFHRAKARSSNVAAKQWESLACALSQGYHEPFGMQMDQPMTTSEERRQRENLYGQAQWEAARLINSKTRAVHAFNLFKSGSKVESKEARYRAMHDPKRREKYKEAKKLHEHRINALMHRSVDDANAMAMSYYDKMEKHIKALKEGEPMEEKMKSRQLAWNAKADEVARQLKRRGD